MSSNDYLDSFPKDTTEAWRMRVERELKGKSYEDFLIWKSTEGFEIEAWQNTRPECLPDLIPNTTPWKIVECVSSTDAKEASKLALNALNAGAEAIWFEKSFLGAAAQVAFQGIDQQIAPIFIRGGNIIDPFHTLLKTGDRTEFKQKETEFYLDGNRLRERGATVIDELALLIAQAIELGKEIHFVSAPLFFSGVGNAFLTEIAKLRALRWLWKSILISEGKEPQNASVLAKNLTITYAQNDEHTNILRATSAAMASVIGGAKFIMIDPWDRNWKEGNPFSARISRNIQNLLKDEARLDKNLNPADGSYFIEHLTIELARTAWKKVQEIERAGGFSAFAENGGLSALLEQSKKKQLDAYQNNASVLLGVNKYTPATPLKEPKFKRSHYALLPDAMNIPAHLQNQHS